METLTTVISLLLLVGLAIIPVIIIRRLNRLKIKYKFFTYLITGISLTVLMTITFAWWADASNKILLDHYGYNIDGMNQAEFYNHVSLENIARVKILEKNIMGVGWPLKAIMNYIFYLPYFLIVYLISYLIQKRRTTPNIGLAKNWQNN